MRIYRELKLQIPRRNKAPRKHVIKGKVSVKYPDLRWAVDVTKLYCGNDGWVSLIGIDCFTRELVGYRFSLRGRAVEAVDASTCQLFKGSGTLKIYLKTWNWFLITGPYFWPESFRKRNGAWVSNTVSYRTTVRKTTG